MRSSITYIKWILMILQEHAIIWILLIWMPNSASYARQIDFFSIKNPSAPYHFSGTLSQVQESQYANPPPFYKQHTSSIFPRPLLDNPVSDEIYRIRYVLNKALPLHSRNCITWRNGYVFWSVLLDYWRVVVSDYIEYFRDCIEYS